MDSNDSTDLKEQKSELELEQARLERIKLELEKMKQESSEKQEDSPKNKEKSPVSQGVIFCLTFLAPIGIVLLWRLKIPTFIKVLLTLYSLFALSMLMGWISFGLPTWFVFMGQ